MGLKDPDTSLAVESGVAETGSTGPIFLNYRHADAGAHAKLLHEHLQRRFGAQKVFLDVVALEPGVDWRKAIRASTDACGVVIVLMGSKWLSIMQERAQRGMVDTVDDVARQEIEVALGRGDIEVVPVLVDDAVMPAAHELPRSLQPLTDRQAEQLRLANYDQDVERLIARLERIASGSRSARSRSAEPGSEKPLPPPPAGPHAAHCERVAGLLGGAGHVVFVLGAGVNAGCGTLLDPQTLADELARRFAYEPESEHLRLGEVAEWVDVTSGRPDLHLHVKQKLAVECQPGTVHRFLATLPARLEALGQPRRHQLIVTTNYDRALERAFEDAQEPFDLAVYTASSGRFFHIPWQRDAEQIVEPNRYWAFPISDDLELSRTVIVKVHGAVDGPDAPYGGEDDYVITEDNYIDYLSGSSVEEIVPFQILQSLRSSHCLFLGYDVANWNLRVFLKRIWGIHIRAKSWAVQEQAREFERVFWSDRGVEVITESLDAYVEALGGCLQART